MRMWWCAFSLWVAGLMFQDQEVLDQKQGKSLLLLSFPLPHTQSLIVGRTWPQEGAETGAGTGATQQVARQSDCAGTAALTLAKNGGAL